jgi:hypothetical protein
MLKLRYRSYLEMNVNFFLEGWAIIGRRESDIGNWTG